MGGAITDNVTGNFHLATGAATLWDNTTKYVRLIQFVDDDGSIADTTTLGLTINNVAVAFHTQLAALTLTNTAIWQAGPFNPGIPISSLIISDMDEGQLHVWID